MGAVWRAEHVQLGTPAAVKLIDASFAENEEALSRFKREAQAAATLRSPHVVQILDYGVDEGTPYIAMELLDGESLADRLQRRRCLTPAETSTLVTHVARAVGKAHDAGIVHRDLKPENIFVVRNDDEEVGKVLDFGIAKSTGQGAGAAVGPQTQTGAMLGTPYYMSPEQAAGRKEVDHRADLWAMAVIAYECLLGRRPFDDDTLGGLVLSICTGEIPVPSQVGPVPPGFDAWFARGCARDPCWRFQSVRDLAQSLRDVCGGDGDRRSYVGPVDSMGSGWGAAGQGPALSLQTPYAPALSNLDHRHLGGTANQAAPTSVTVDTTGRSHRTGLVLTAGATAVLLLAVGSVVAYVTATRASSSTPTEAELTPAAAPAAAPSALQQTEPPPPSVAAVSSAQPVASAVPSVVAPASRPAAPAPRPAAPAEPKAVARPAATAPARPPPPSRPEPRPPPASPPAPQTPGVDLAF